MDLSMDEYNFVSIHQGVVQSVISKGAFKDILGMLRISSFAKKVPKSSVEEERNEDVNPVEEDSEQISSVVTKETIKSKSSRKRKAGNRKSVTTSVNALKVSPKIDIPKCDMTTQTDSDFEGYLEMSDEQFLEYQRYKEYQAMQQYLVNSIVEEDFVDYEN